MRPGKRFGLSAAEKSEVWRRWKAGETQHEIGRAFGKEHSCIRSVLLPRGGIAPLTRRRSRLALNLAEREDISRGIASGLSIREIARRTNRAASTVSREVTRHGGRSAYRAQDADRQAWISALRPKRCLLATNRKLRNIVASKLVLDWSPEQISGWLKNRYPDDPSMRVSHETIYRSLFIQARGVLKKELMGYLRSKRRMRRSRHPYIHGHGRNHRHPFHSRTTRGGGRPSDSWSLGRRSAGRRKQQLHCDTGGATFPFSHADQGAEQRHGGGRGGIEQTCSQTSGHPATLAHVGSGTGDGQAQGVYCGHRCAGLLLRSTESVAAWNQREYESAIAAILPARNRPVFHLSRAARLRRAALESTPQKNPRIPNSCE